MPAVTIRYANGHVPAELMVTFNRGFNQRDGNWTHSFPPATYARHLALIKRAKDRTGRTLALNYGWTAYRPLWAQSMLKQYYTSIGQPNQAATPGTSSHGGFWEGRQTMAGDYSNWADVYAGFGGRAAFAQDCAAVGLQANMITPARGYPDEPWHVIDPNPWSAVPAFDGVVLPFNPGGADMPLDANDKQLIKDAIVDVLTGYGAGPGGRNHFDSLKFLAGAIDSKGNDVLAAVKAVDASAGLDSQGVKDALIDALTTWRPFDQGRNIFDQLKLLASVTATLGVAGGASLEQIRAEFDAAIIEAAKRTAGLT